MLGLKLKWEAYNFTLKIVEVKTQGLSKIQDAVQQQQGQKCQREDARTGKRQTTDKRLLSFGMRQHLKIPRLPPFIPVRLLFKI
jgi:nicotinic acid phosphoribosyltransferase